MSYVYLICVLKDGHFVGPCKVGITGSLKTRLSGLQTGSPNKLVFYEVWDFWRSPQLAAEVEKMFHRTQADRRLIGEWFDYSPEAARQLLELGIAVGMVAAGGLTIEQAHEVLPYGEVQSAYGHEGDAAPLSLRHGTITKILAGKGGLRGAIH